MLDEHHLFEDYRICSWSSMIVAVIRLQPLAPPPLYQKNLATGEVL